MRRRMRRHLRAGRYVRKVIMRLRRAVVLDADALQRLPHELDVVNAMMVRHYVLGRVFDTNEYWESLQQAWEDPCIPELRVAARIPEPLLEPIASNGQ